MGRKAKPPPGSEATLRPNTPAPAPTTPGVATNTSTAAGIPHPVANTPSQATSTIPGTQLLTSLIIPDTV